MNDLLSALLSEAYLFLEESLKTCSSNQWEKANITEDEIRILHRLNGYCAMLSQTVLQMIGNDIVWECEIIMRTISEGTIKLVYMCCEAESIKAKIQQYSEELSDYAFNKDSRRASEYVDKVSGIDDVHRHTYLALNKLKVKTEKQRKEQKQSEQAWSFLEMLRQIEKASLPFSDQITAMAYGYGLSSHFVHADSEAIGLIWDRAHREQDEQVAVTMANKGRFVSDLTAMTLLRTWTLVQAGDGDVKRIERLIDLCNNLNEKACVLERVDAILAHRR